MTREEAIKLLRDLWNEVYNEDSDGYNYAIAIDMAIEALSPKDGDLISRADAIRAVAEHYSFDDGCRNIYKDMDYYKGIAEHILKNVPSAEAETKWNCTANFVADMKKKFQCMTAEEQYKVLERILGRPQGEWTYLSGSKGSYMTISCPICGSTFDGVAEWKYNFCPNCGADMRGAK